MRLLLPLSKKEPNITTHLYSPSQAETISSDNLGTVSHWSTTFTVSGWQIEGV